MGQDAKLLVRHMEAYACESQCGGIRFRGTDPATHTVREFFAQAKAAGTFAAALFVDLSAAFDSVTREVSLAGRMQPQVVRQNLHALGIDADIVRAILVFLEG